MRVQLRSASGRHPAARAGTPPALQGLDLDIAPGEQVAVIGPSGAGKTTLLHLLACALQPSAGAVTLDGRDPWRESTRELQRLRGQLFLAPQVPPLPPRQRVVTAVLAGRLPHIGLVHALRSLFYPTSIADADAALARFDLSDKLFARVDRLSGGERQRVGLARALLSQARLLLVDEPL
ncbi:MAG: phosphonate ABC transporter, partial [Burkholderiales bacterium PBB5]